VGWLLRLLVLLLLPSCWRHCRAVLQLMTGEQV
jgi:hypothetical protein